MELHKLHMKGGENEESYAKNSSGQGLIIMKSKHLLDQSIKELSLSNLPECMTIADLGCSSGPNTFLAVGIIIESIATEFNKSNKKLPSFQVFLNDLVSTDFNTVFNLLPSFYGELEKKGLQSGSCFVAAMPGSFYERLFPANSMHFIHSANSLHWLSQVPKGLVNKRNIYIAKGNPPSVREAYLVQFQEDFTNFLMLRSIEMVSHGQLFFNLSSGRHGTSGYNYQEMLGMTLNDMVIEGSVDETKLDTFNLPLYEPSEEEVRQIIEKQGSFKIMHLEAIEIAVTSGNLPDSLKEIAFDRNAFGEFLAKTFKAAYGPIIGSHFGEAIIDDLFSRYARKLSEYMEGMKPSGAILVVSLSRK